jgi:predicted Zn finger-like uncharacterized protein
MVGVAGFEPATLWSQTRCATRLRYTPNDVLIQHILIFSKHKQHLKRAFFNEYVIYKSMIISCEKCQKNFEVQSKLIPNPGRVLQCGSCNHKWFFRIDINIDIQKKETDDVIKNQEQLENIKKDDLDINNEVEIISGKKNKKTSLKFLNLLIIFVISFITLIIIADTFKLPISKIIPNIDFILKNLYETIKDIFLFFKDLTL